mmetsp:Transcript_11744/g.25783  ORF Transcript_11744/g.25783 Transcript_11744/m.25783 type:complete len:249 (+) Transcript_11744:2357-3103(+)
MGKGGGCSLAYGIRCTRRCSFLIRRLVCILICAWINRTPEHLTTKSPLLRMTILLATFMRTRHIRTRTLGRTPQRQFPLGTRSFLRQLLPKRSCHKVPRPSNGIRGRIGGFGRTEAFVRAEGVDAYARWVAAMSHGVGIRDGTFVDIQYRKGDFKALSYYGAAMFVHGGLGGRRGILHILTISVTVTDRLGQPSNRTLDNPLPHPPMQFGTTPRHFHIDYARYIPVDLCDYHAEYCGYVGGCRVLGVG